MLKAFRPRGGLAVPPALAEAQRSAVASSARWPSKSSRRSPSRTWSARTERIGTTGTIETAGRDRVFELVLAADMPTRWPRLGLTVEAIAAPFADDNDVELEFEANLHIVTDALGKGWVTSHFDVVDQFSPAERPAASQAYTHKLDFELDTAVHLFNFLPEGRWLRGVELETSLDYLATGIPKAGDVFDTGVTSPRRCEPLVAVVCHRGAGCTVLAPLTST